MSNHSGMRKILIMAVCLLLTICWSCKESENHKLLIAAEEMMQANPNPDSAMVLLDRIDTASLSASRGDNALYALLLSQAKDKLNYTVTDDSLINIAVEYFADTNDKYHQMLSYYYLATILYSADKKSESLREFFKAAAIAEDLNNEFWKGMSYRGISDIFSDTFDSQEELSYARKEHEAFKKAGIQPYVNYSILDLCRALSSTTGFIEADSLSAALLDSAELYKDHNLNVEIKRLIGLNAYLKNEYGKEVEAYIDVCNSGISDYKDSIYLVLGLTSIGNLEKADYLFRQLAPSDGFYDFAKYKLLLTKKDSLNAFLALQKLYDEEVSHFRGRMGQDMTSSLHVMHRDERLSNLSKIDRLHYSIVIIVLSVFLLITISSFVVYIYIKRNRKRVMKQTHRLMALEELLKSKETKMKDNENRSDQLRYNLKKIIISRYDILNRFGKLIYENPDSKVAEKKLFKAFNEMIESLSTNSSLFMELEKMANENFDGIMDSLRTELPDLKEVDYRIFLLLIFKFSYIVISMILKDESIASLYQRKKRLKQKIRTTQNAEIYLSFLKD